MKTSIRFLIVCFFLLSAPVVNAQNGVGVNTLVPKSSLDDNGSFGKTVTPITSNTTLTQIHSTVVCNNTSNITVTLPAASTCARRIYEIKRSSVSTHLVTISGTIDGVANYRLTYPNQSITLFSDSTNWFSRDGSGDNDNWKLTGNRGTTPATNFIGTIDNNILAFRVNNTERMFLRSTGADVFQNLRVQGTLDNTDNQIRIHNNNSNTFFDYNGGSVNFRDEGAASSLFIEDASRNVGIGTATPGAKLDVNGNFIARGMSKLCEQTFGFGDLMNTGQGGYVVWNYEAIAGYGSSGITNFVNHRGGGPGGFSWSNTNDMATFSNMMTLTARGVTAPSSTAYLGILTSNPESNLEVNGSFGKKVTSITGNTTLNDTHGTIVCNTNAATVTLPSAANSGARVYEIKRAIGNANNITIVVAAGGTIDGAASYILSKAGQSVTVFSDGAIWLIRDGSGERVAGDDWNILGNTGTTAGTNFIGTTDAVDFVTKTSGVERMRVLSSGNIGIGTTTPTYKLHIREDLANNKTTPLILQNRSLTAGAEVAIRFSPTDQETIRGSEISGINNGSNRIDLKFSIQAGEPFLERMRLNSYGNLGIGTTNQDNYGRLTVMSNGEGNAQEDDLSIVSYNTIPSPAIQTFSSRGTESVPTNLVNSDQLFLFNSYGRINGASAVSTRIAGNYVGNGTTNLSTLSFSTSGTTPRMFIASDGDVGIGTTDPQRKLEVLTAAASAFARISNNTTDYLDIGFNHDGIAANKWASIGTGSTTHTLCLQPNAGALIVGTAHSVEGIANVHFSYPTWNANGFLLENGAGVSGSYTNIAPGYKGTTAINGDLTIRSVLRPAPQNPGTIWFGNTIAPTNDQIFNIGTSAERFGNAFISSTVHIGSNANKSAILNNGSDSFFDFYGGDVSFRDQGAMNNLFLEDVTGNVGIGTGGPQQRLSVQGGMNIDQGNQNTGTGTITNFSLRFGSNSGEGIGSNRSGAGSNPLGLDFYTSSALRMVIENQGDVGIGTGDPSCRLDVRNDATGATGNVKLQLARTAAGDVGMSFNQIGQKSYGIVLRDNATVTGTPGRLAFVDSYFPGGAGSEIMCIGPVPNGYVGIGINAPTEKLHIYTGGATGPSTLLESDGGGPSKICVHKIRTWNGMAANTYVGYGAVDDGAASARAALFVPNAANTGVMEAVSVLKSTGNVGIGTTTPTGKLHVFLNADPNVYLENGADNSILREISTNYNFSDGVGARIYAVRAAGAVFTTATLQFAVNGNNNRMFIDGAGAKVHQNVFVQGALGTTTQQLRIHNNNADTYIDYHGGNVSFRDQGAGTATLFLEDVTGNVGIGTGTPRGVFDVARNGDIYLTNNTTTGTTNSVYLTGHVYLAPYTGGNVSYLMARRSTDAGSTELQIRTFNAGAMVEAVRIASDGDVGIGTTAPACKLDVVGTTNINYSNYGRLVQGGPYTQNIAGPTAIATSIRASGNIAAAGYVATSDNRVKKEIVALNNKNDLELLRKINLVHFKYIDTLEYSTFQNKGVIAQEIKKILPQAVNESSKVIPNVFELSQEVVYDTVSKELTVRTTKPHDFKKGDKIRVYDSQNNLYDLEVANTPTQKTFVISDWKEKTERIFVYGKFVNDFHTVNYDYLFTTGLSAMQEMIRQQDLQEKQIQQLKAENGEIKSSNKEIEHRLAEIESLLKGEVKEVSVRK